ncbi:MAG TPA: hypothetical protein VE954_23950 [Oligoflexus sp.]|uniref:hypothetical protein n=1 Tax=Oligoflexus sp. TaxID=1971216 RepID=UPI002D6E8B97|nr:hypothetical protein [Oligoflexus sp.]HYX36167.1 hypothetical protein [Oligoflexus sp.]
MKRLWLVPALVLFVACDNSKFSGAQVSDASPPTPTPSENVKVPSIEEKEEDTDYKECLLATGGDATSIISVSQGNIDVSKLTPNSVLLLEVQGQALIDLSAVQLTSLKGICIFAAGGAKIDLDLTTTVLAMYYHARGNSVTNMNFGGTGSLAKLETDVSGGSQLTLEGQQLTCSSLKLPQSGSSRITCNGTDL